MQKRQMGEERGDARLCRLRLFWLEVPVPKVHHHRIAFHVPDQAVSKRTVCNYSPPHRCEKLSQIRHVPERRIQRRSMGVRPQVSNVPEETIQTSSRLATRLTSHRQLLSTWRWLDIGVSC